MTHRERLVMALEHKEPDRVPIDFGGMISTGIHIQAQEKLKKHLGLNGPPGEVVDMFQQLARPDPILREIFQADVYPVYARPSKEWKLKIWEEGDFRYYIDEWKITYRCPKIGGYWFDLYRHPMENIDTISGLQKYHFPDPRDPGRTEGLLEEVMRIYQKTDYAMLVNSPTAGLFEHPYFLRGLENWFIDLSTNLKFAEALVDRVLEWQMVYWEEILTKVGKYIQVVQIGDDLGGQAGPLISPSLYRKIFKGRRKKLISLIKRYTPAKIFLHSCGEIYQFIPDFIEEGVEVLNPVQIACPWMGDTARLKREFGEDISFWGGGCDTQRILPYGTSQEVDNEVRRRIKDLAPGGGFVFTMVHNIQPDVPPENVIAMFRAAIKYGHYPIFQK